MKKFILSAFSGILFIFFLSTGFHLAQRKPIWNDEILTQTQAVDQLSYGTLMRGIIKGEGNNHPLFYIFQKMICDLNHYRFPKDWEGEYLFSDPHSQKIMRIGSNVFMSAALVLLFYFFSVRYSWGAGLYAVLMALLSAMTWIYWVEARPYSLWFLLSVIQSLLLLKLFEEKRLTPFLFFTLSAAQVLLALTTFASMIQIIAASLLVAYILREKFWRHAGLLTALPLAFGGFYYFQGTKFALAVPPIWGKLLLVHLPFDRMAFFAVYILFLFSLRRKEGERHEENRNYLYFFCLILGATAVYCTFKQLVGVENIHNWIKEKYFLYLTPAVIMATVLFSIDLLKTYRNDRWAIFNIILGLSGLVIIRFLGLYLEIMQANLTLNFLGDYW